MTLFVRSYLHGVDSDRVELGEEVWRGPRREDGLVEAVDAIYRLD